MFHLTQNLNYFIPIKLNSLVTSKVGISNAKYGEKNETFTVHRSLEAIMTFLYVEKLRVMSQTSCVSMRKSQVTPECCM